MKKSILITALFLISSCLIFAQEDERDIYEQIPEDIGYSAYYPPPPQNPDLMLSAWSEFILTFNYDPTTDIENILNTRPEVTPTLTEEELQALLEANQQDLLSMISSISKSLYDSVLAIIRNLR
ncbi:MAG: hypothetical protein V2I37_11060 [Marinilabiliaceae bacterium]|jgi:hypothetical protein|nr:hypothetical protein [Marinilabiliaceae bacterium]